MLSEAIRVDTGLNLLWLAISVCACLLLAHHERLRATPGRMRRWIAVLTLTLALFPCVSVSDDEASLWFLNTHSQRGGVGGTPVEEREKESAAQSLARLFDTIETFQLQGVWALLVSVSFFAMTLRPARRLRECFCFALSGRAPPSLAS